MSLDKFGRTSEPHYAPKPFTPRLPFFYTAIGAIDFEGRKIIHIDTPTDPTDIANKSYVDGRVETLTTTCHKKIDSLSSQIQKEIHNNNIEMKNINDDHRVKLEHSLNQIKHENEEHWHSRFASLGNEITYNEIPIKKIEKKFNELKKDFQRDLTRVKTEVEEMQEKRLTTIINKQRKDFEKSLEGVKVEIASIKK